MNPLVKRVVGAFKHRVMGEPSCEEVNRFLAEYVDGSLDEGTLKKYEKHMGDCECCGHYLDQYKQTIELAHSCKDSELPPDLVEHTLAFLRKHRGEA